MLFLINKKKIGSKKKILCSGYTQYTQNNCIFLNTGPIKTFLLTKTLYLSKTNYKKVQNSNRSPKNYHADNQDNGVLHYVEVFVMKPLKG